jgi:hypothetical protein
MEYGKNLVDVYTNHVNPHFGECYNVGAYDLFYDVTIPKKEGTPMKALRYLLKQPKEK